MADGMSKRGEATDPAAIRQYDSNQLNVTQVHGKMGLAKETHMNEATAEKVIDIIESRRINRAADYADLVVTLDEWAVDDDWLEDGAIAPSRILLVGRVDVHSEKAYLLRGAHFVRTRDTKKIDGGAFAIEDVTIKEADEEWITTKVGTIDQSDTDFHNKPRRMYAPRSAVEAIVEVM